MTDTTIDYASVTVADLDIKREPRKSKFALVHTPTGRIAEDPVVPGSLTEARFRRHTGLPKENRIKDMIGYIESKDDDDKNFYPIVGGENPRNEYLDALTKDPAALKACFEGPPQTSDSTPAQQVTPPMPDPAEATSQEQSPQPPTTEAQEPPQTEAPETPQSENGAQSEATEVQPSEPEEALPAPAPTEGEPVNEEEIGDLDQLLAGLQEPQQQTP